MPVRKETGEKETDDQKTRRDRVPGGAPVAEFQADAMITFLRLFKYVTAIVVALSVAASALAALFFLAFCDHGPFLWCLMYAAIAPGIAVIEVALQIKASALLKQRRRLGLSAFLMCLSIAPTLVGVVVFRHVLGS